MRLYGLLCFVFVGNCMACDIPQQKKDQILRLSSSKLVEHTTDLCDEEEDELLSIANETVAVEIGGLAEACEQSDSLLEFLENVQANKIKLTPFQRKCFEIWLQTVIHSVMGEGIGPIYENRVREKIVQVLS